MLSRIALIGWLVVGAFVLASPAIAGYGPPPMYQPPTYQPPAVSYTLSVTRLGSGSGTVTSEPAGIDCGSDCSQAYAGGSVVTLTATAATGSTFTGFGGACSGAGPTCSVTIGSADASVSATFAVAAAPTTPTAGSDTSVEAKVESLKTERSSKGRRRVEIELSAEEQVNVGLELVRGGRTLAAKHVGAFRPGSRSVYLSVPPTADGGKAKVLIALVDTSGNKMSLARSIRLPSP